MTKPRARRTRSAVSNGSRLFLGEVDGRGSLARRFADLVEELERERGGPEAMSCVHRNAVRAYAGLCVERERIEARMAVGEAVNLETYGQIIDRADRAARRMGPVKAAKAPSIREHIAARRASKGQS